MMSGEIRHGGSGEPHPSTARSVDVSRNLGNGRHSPTPPLKLFGQAKKKINDIFIDISNYIDETNEFLQGMEVNGDVVDEKHREKLQGYTSKIGGIRDILSRDRMKVAFFGRTSNGKSTVINAMLRNKILPSGIGHTTHCFLQVEGVDANEGYLLREDSKEPVNIQSIGQLASALSHVKLEPNALIRLCWPKDKCVLLKDDVVLVDSPGIDVSPDLDTWIDKHCLDADVFVLVANAESTLMQTEKNFFHNVSSKLSKPNIFIINNRWDASASEPEMMQEVKAQHMERNVAFLADELNVVDRREAENRVFFVSAREALITRLGSNLPAPSTPGGQLLDGHQNRYFEFTNFERKFEECISQTAVQTKFAQHTENGKGITSSVRSSMEDICTRSGEKKTCSEQSYREMKDRLDYTEQQLNLLTEEIKNKIKQMTEEVERKVSIALVDEIRRLAILVDEFDRPFHPDPMLMHVYKKELHFHLEETMCRNLHGRCNSFIRQVVDATNFQMGERLAALLPEENKQQASNILPAKDFTVMYRLDCRNLCGDFQEEIEFRFSLGVTALMNRFLGPRGTKVMLTGYGQVPRPMSSVPQTPSNEAQMLPSQDSEMLMAALGTFSSLYSRSTIGTLAIAGVVGKAAGWRIIAVCGAVYGLVYVYERLTWTNKAKERAFKRQYVDYATSKLRLIVDLTSANCSHQVQQELSSTFARLCHQVDVAKDEFQGELETLEGEISKLEDVEKKSKILRNKAGYLESELNSFVHKYLTPDSRI